MKRKILVGVIAGTLLVSAGTIGSIAVSAHRNGNQRNDCGSFIDENSNSICDNYENGNCPANGTGKGNGNCNSNFTDEDSNGICDNYENNNCPANGASKGNGSCGDNFTDEDNDGVCDNYAQRERPMDGTGRKCGMNSGSHCGKGHCGNR